MRKNNIKPTPKKSIKEKTFDDKAYKVLIVLVIISLIYRAFFKAHTVGHDYRYTLFVVSLPILIGVVLLGYYRRDFLKKRIFESNKLLIKSILILFYLIQGLLFSYISIGVASEATWNYFNKKTAKENFTETFQCKITGFLTQTGSMNPGFYFLFQGKNEAIRSDYNTMKNYLKKNPDNYEVIIQARKGIWNYYVIYDWTIKTTANM